MEWRAYLIVAAFLLAIGAFGIYVKVHWRDQCRRNREERARRKEEEMDISDLSEEWADLDRHEEDDDISEIADTEKTK